MKYFITDSRYPNAFVTYLWFEDFAKALRGIRDHSYIEAGFEPAGYDPYNSGVRQ